MKTIERVLINLQCELVAERNRINPKSISWLQYDILNILQSEKEVLPSKLSKLLGISRSKLSKALKELKGINYIKQKPNQNDGRELVTTLTDAGKEFMKNIDKNHCHLLGVANLVFDKKEKVLFKELGEKYLKALRIERLKDDE